MQYLSPIIGVGYGGELIGALLIIVTGIALEKKLNAATIILNILAIVWTIVSSGVDVIVLPLLIVYISSGLLIVFFKLKHAYGFLGLKTYGSLMFAIALLHTPGVQEGLSAFNLSVTQLGLFSTIMVLGYWLIIAFFVYLLAWIFRKKRKRAKN